VVRLLAERGVASVRGNVERKVLQAAEEPRKIKKLLRSKGTAASAWAARSLGEAEIEWLRALPGELVLRFSGSEVLVVHGSPLSDTDYVFPSITGAALEAKLGGRRPRVLVCGHSHIPFTRVVHGVRVVNCGSVGKPVDGDPRGSLALCDFQPGGRVTAKIVRFAYPVAPLVADLEHRGAPRVRPHEYLHGVKLKEE
jgi:predicted phosphodiesterase